MEIVRVNTGDFSINARFEKNTQKYIQRIRKVDSMSTRNHTAANGKIEEKIDKKRERKKYI